MASFSFADNAVLASVNLSKMIVVPVVQVTGDTFSRSSSVSDTTSGAAFSPSRPVQLIGKLIAVRIIFSVSLAGTSQIWALFVVVAVFDLHVSRIVVQMSLGWVPSVGFVVGGTLVLISDSSVVEGTLVNSESSVAGTGISLADIGAHSVAISSSHLGTGQTSTAGHRTG